MYPARLFVPNWLHAWEYSASVVRLAYGSSQNSAVRLPTGPWGEGGEGEGGDGGPGTLLCTQC